MISRASLHHKTPAGRPCFGVILRVIKLYTHTHTHTAFTIIFLWKTQSSEKRPHSCHLTRVESYQRVCFQIASGIDKKPLSMYLQLFHLSCFLWHSENMDHRWICYTKLTLYFKPSLWLLGIKTWIWRAEYHSITWHKEMVCYLTLSCHLMNVGQIIRNHLQAKIFPFRYLIKWLHKNKQHPRKRTSEIRTDTRWRTKCSVSCVPKTKPLQTHAWFHLEVFCEPKEK